MAFSDFKNVHEVSEKYGTIITNGHFLPNNLKMSIPDLFMKDLEYSLRNKKRNPSEIAVSENFISPMIRFVAQKHPHIIVWSREYYLKADEELCGTPDYLFSYRERTDAIMLRNPLICISEAKIDNFIYAWGQTLAEMVAIQKLGYDFTVYGWATNGDIWQFGKLENNVFTQHSESFSIANNTKKIAGILDWIFTESVRNAEDFLERNKK